MSTSETRALNEPLRVYEHPEFISREECAHMILCARREGMSAAKLVGEKDGVDQITEARTNKSTWLDHDYDETTLSICQRIADKVGMPLDNAEKIQCIYYLPNEFYKPHFDGWDINANPFDRTHEENVIKEMYMDQQGGQRLVTCLVYLNHVEAGGYTRFPILDRNVAPAVGKLLIFHNTFENSTMLHPHSLHEGSPVVKGEKYAFNLWFRESRARR